jgi:glycyl-tRNA synthetase
VAYDEKDAVGRRYRRQDALGTPFCITVDHQTLEDETVTIRHRDSMKQDRVKISDLNYQRGIDQRLKNHLEGF